MLLVSFIPSRRLIHWGIEHLLTRIIAGTARLLHADRVVPVFYLVEPAKLKYRPFYHEGGES